MAEKDAGLAVENAVEQLVAATRILQKVNKLKNLRNSLKQIDKIVKEYDGQEYEPEVAKWLSKVKEVAYESQNLIGTIVADVNLQNQRSKLRRLLSVGRTNNSHEDEIKEISERVESIAGSFKEPRHDDDMSTDIDKIVGFENLKEALVRDLICENRPQRDAILIAGKAGSGKTTLAKIVYNNKAVTGYFKYREWVYIPKELTLNELLWRILKHIDPVCNQTGDDIELKDKLSESLKCKKYLIVFDNIHNNESWDELLKSFPNEKNGSRMLLTSRLNLQAPAITRRHEIKPLDPDESWKILSRKVFFGETCPSDLEIIGKQMVAGCKGSPRAVDALATILCQVKQTQELWSKILEDVHQGEKILDLSNYKDQLCGELQLCFLYLGLFHGEFKVPAKAIIRMWIAEGLIKERESQRAEEIGKDYLEKLIDGSFIKGTRRVNGTVKTCHISSHVSSFCVKEGEGITEVYMGTNSLRQENPTNGEFTQKHSKGHGIRLAIHGDSHMNILKTLKFCSDMQPHSLHLFGKNDETISISSNDLLGILHHTSPHLKVLNLGCIELDRVPKVLCELKLLTYLRLRIPTATNLPSSIGNLQQLETLDMRESKSLKVPHELWKINSLRHLYLGEFSIPAPRGKQYFKALLSLQTLYGVQSNKVLKRLMVRAKFPNVRKLRICSLKPDVTLMFLDSLDHLYHLEYLRIERQTILPDAHAFPLSLGNLTLFETELKPDCIKTLEKLPNLKMLKLLKDAIRGETIECSAHGFLRLEFLRMEFMNLKQWKLGEGAMPCLRHLLIKDLPTLTVPERLNEQLNKAATN